MDSMSEPRELPAGSSTASQEPCKDGPFWGIHVVHEAEGSQQLRTRGVSVADTSTSGSVARSNSPSESPEPARSCLIVYLQALVLWVNDMLHTGFARFKFHFHLGSVPHEDFRRRVEACIMDHFDGVEKRNYGGALFDTGSDVNIMSHDFLMGFGISDLRMQQTENPPVLETAQGVRLSTIGVLSIRIWIVPDSYSNQLWGTPIAKYYKTDVVVFNTDEKFDMLFGKRTINDLGLLTFHVSTLFDSFRGQQPKENITAQQREAAERQRQTNEAEKKKYEETKAYERQANQVAEGNPKNTKIQFDSSSSAGT